MEFARSRFDKECRLKYVMIRYELFVMMVDDVDD